MEKPIFDLIGEALTEDDCLPDGFSLPSEKAELDRPFPIRLAPGASDGIIFYHVAGYSEDEKAKNQVFLIQSICAASDKDFEAAARYAESFAEDGIMLEHIDDVQQYLIDNKTELDTGNIMSFAFNLIFGARRKEAVKLGLSLLELYDTNQNEDLKQPIRLLALYDEFTLFCAFNMRSWDNAASEMLEIAKKVESWGRIHIMRMIEPDSEEIERWILLHGVDNCVMAAYSGVDCYKKVHYLDRLNGKLALDEYRGLAAILDALLDEGPVEGLSSLDERKEVIRRFMAATFQRADLAANDYEPLLNLLAYVEEKENDCSEFAEEIREFIFSDSAKEAIYAALKDGKCFDVARRMRLDYQPYAYETVLNDCIENSWWASMLIADDYRSEEIIKLLCDTIGLENIATGSAKEMAFGEGRKKYLAIDFVLQSIRGKVGIGLPLIKAALLSPVISNRNGALRVISSWMQKTQLPLENLNPELYNLIKEIKPNEVDENVADSMCKVLNGKAISNSEDADD